MKKYAMKLEICLQIEAPKVFFELFNINKHYQLVDNPNINKSAIIKVLLGDNVNVSWEETSKELSITCIKIDNSVLEMVNTMINALFIRELEYRKIYMLHASCVYSKKNNKFLVLFGDSGAGKTTVMLDLIKKYNLNYVSNGATLIQEQSCGFKVIGSYKKGIKLRSTSIKEYDSNLFHTYFKNVSSLEKKEVSPLDLKLPIHNHYNNVSTNCSLYFIKLSQSPFLINKNKNYRISMILYNDIARHIKFSDYYTEINNYPVFIPSLDSEELFTCRIKFINNFLNKNFCGFIHGNLVDTIDYIGEKHDL